MSNKINYADGTVQLGAKLQMHHMATLQRALQAAIDVGENASSIAEVSEALGITLEVEDMEKKPETESETGGPDSIGAADA